MNSSDKISSDQISEEVTRKILKQRARKLAETPEETTYDTLEILKFTMSDETYAFETKDVREVFNVREIIALPSTPEFLKGIINVRGEIVSVIDIRLFFNLEKSEEDEIKSIIIIQLNKKILGILADEITGVFRISKENIQSSLPTLDVSRHKYLKGITRNRVIILSATNILNDKNLIIDEEI